LAPWRSDVTSIELPERDISGANSAYYSERAEDSLSSEVKQPETVTDHSPPYGAQVHNAWGYTSWRDAELNTETTDLSVTVNQILQVSCTFLFYFTIAI
jgi:hypothetical protein